MILSALGTDRLRKDDADTPQVIRLATPIRGGRSDAFAVENAERTINEFLEAYAEALTSAEPARSGRQR